MVTPNMTEVPNQYLGLSTDEKPTGVAENCLFLELDTGTVYYYDSGSWVAFGESPPVLLYENEDLAVTVEWLAETWIWTAEIELSASIALGQEIRATINDNVVIVSDVSQSYGDSIGFENEADGWLAYGITTQGADAPYIKFGCRNLNDWNPEDTSKTVSVKLERI